MSHEPATRTAAPADVRTPSGAAAPAGEPAPPAAAASRGVWFARLVMVAVVLAALNLRPAITSLGALLEEVRAGLNMSGAVAGVLTSVPAVTFAVFGIAAPRLARRHGPAAVVCAGMVAIAAGLLIRPYAGGTPGFVAATALALIGIAVSNVLMPVIVKRYFPDRVGTMTGLYSMSLAIGTSVAAAATVPLTGALGGHWRTGLALWGVLAVVAVVPWILVVRTLPRRTGEAPAAAAPAPAAPGRPAGSIVRSPTAWALAGFFGLQATGAYITMGWLPQIFRDAGVPASTAGVLLAVTMVMGVPLAFVIPRLAARFRTQGPIAAVLGLSGLAGYTGLLVAPAEGAWAWALLLGLSNCAFPLALTMIGMRSRSAAGTVRLSAFAQSTGYLISIPGPLLIGVLYEHTGSWGLPVALMAGLLVPQIVLGTLAGRDRTIEDETGMRD
ncbi:CynX/NimT family MFS transporter [Streptomyces qinzhouensis]|uniref:MFS transporter n=1 Tax=Streptomyces qinzhouensis TaxID=2599401 RepID=A0A5B8JF93_9ACTN|nr:MFS transporter [Streptomyces qinzhouensis]QDY76113.1 MFS transporter [Streptomyces qinzhouensis]